MVDKLNEIIAKVNGRKPLSEEEEVWLIQNGLRVGLSGEIRKVRDYANGEKLNPNVCV